MVHRACSGVRCRFGIRVTTPDTGGVRLKSSTVLKMMPSGWQGQSAPSNLSPSRQSRYYDHFADYIVLDPCLLRLHQADAATHHAALPPSPSFTPMFYPHVWDVDFLQTDRLGFYGCRMGVNKGHGGHPPRAVTVPPTTYSDRCRWCPSYRTTCRRRAGLSACASSSPGLRERASGAVGAASPPGLRPAIPDV
jgi:hypothetical protein